MIVLIISIKNGCGPATPFWAWTHSRKYFSQIVQTYIDLVQKELCENIQPFSRSIAQSSRVPTTG